MSRKTLIGAIGFWVINIFVAILNGAIRGALIEPNIGEQAAHQLGTLTGIILFLIVIWIFVWHIKPRQDELIYVGIFWVAITIIFEFIFGYYVMGHTLEELCFDYNICAGRLWILVLLTIFIGPYLIGKAMKRP